jgi:hypothetical protein
MYRGHIIMFIVMTFVGILFNPMNVLAYKVNHLYFSLTLFYSGLLMASNMIWAHEIVHYFNKGHFKVGVFIIGIFLSVSISILLLRNQLLVDDKEWLKRMITHHSSALTTTNQILKKIKYSKENPQLYRLAKDIVFNQEREILFMKNML